MFFRARHFICSFAPRIGTSDVPFIQRKAENSYKVLSPQATKAVNRATESREQNKETCSFFCRDRVISPIYRQSSCKSRKIRQFILVSDGAIPSRFFLHGKVERRAIGRIGDQLYFIATRHKETLWDFTDALREYGFIDAIYITGGADYVFYRDKDRFKHDIGKPDEYPHEKWEGIIPWLVFRKQ